MITVDFLINGGDDFKNVINKIYTPRNMKDLGPLRESLKSELIKMESIEEKDVIDPERPRLILTQK